MTKAERLEEIERLMENGGEGMANWNQIAVRHELAFVLAELREARIALEKITECNCMGKCSTACSGKIARKALGRS